MANTYATQNVAWGMEKPYAATSLERNYWDPNSQAGQAQQGFVNRQMSDVANQYGQRGTQLKGELAGQGIGSGGTIGQFAQAQKIANPQAATETGILNNQFNQNWQGEQGQLGRQQDYTQQLNQLGLQKALAEQSARYGNRQFDEGGVAAGNANMQGMVGGLGKSLIQSIWQ